MKTIIKATTNYTEALKIKDYFITVKREKNTNYGEPRYTICVYKLLKNNLNHINYGEYKCRGYKYYLEIVKEVINLIEGEKEI